MVAEISGILVGVTSVPVMETELELAALGGPERAFLETCSCRDENADAVDCISATNSVSHVGILVGNCEWIAAIAAAGSVAARLAREGGIALIVA